MGREIRMVPPNWSHPKLDPNGSNNPYRHEGFQPMHDEHYDDALTSWLADFDRIRADGVPDSEKEYYPRGLGDWFKDYPPPDPDMYRTWRDNEATWFQVWQTVSEGSPVTPPFATRAELVDYLVKHGDFWDQKRREGGWKREHAEKFVNAGWAPSMMVEVTAAGSIVKEPRDGI